MLDIDLNSKMFYKLKSDIELQISKLIEESIKNGKAGEVGIKVSFKALKRTDEDILDDVTKYVPFIEYEVSRKLKESKICTKSVVEIVELIVEDDQIELN